MSEPATLSLAEARERLQRRELSAAELLRSCRARIERWNPRLNAFISLEERNPGAGSGPLAGVPLAHKDMFYRAGKVSNCGSKIRKGWVARETSAALERLDAAGALDIGTLNMSEFAYGPTGHNDHWGDCRNPWNPDCITGGSSSGSGAAVAARLVFGALGSDTGGSVRLPAAA
ncbi:MAG TPA: amidase, partial [Gaiellaceae bacterium]